MQGAYIIDFNLLNEHELGLDEFVLLLRLKCNSIDGIHKGEFESLKEKMFVKENDANHVILREKAKILFELITIDQSSFKAKKVVKKSSRLLNEELDGFITEFRALWRGKKLGSMGSQQGCKDKMYRWMQENPGKTKGEILRATKLYLESVDNNHYLQRADYFIFKREVNGEEASRLSAFIEEVNTRPISDWTTNLQ
jgi:hypothetical protein